MNRLAARIFGLAFFLGIAGAQAQANGVSIEEIPASASFKVTLDNASIVDVLRTLEDKYGIEVRGLEDVTETDPVSANFTGKLPDILNRLLRNQNFSIVRSNANRTGVVKIFIAAVKAPSEKGAPAAPPPKNSQTEP